MNTRFTSLGFSAGIDRPTGSVYAMLDLQGNYM
jgi:hypothetical protein